MIKKYIFNKSSLLLLLASTFLLFSYSVNEGEQSIVTVVDKPDTNGQNSFYLNNRAPLVQNAFLKLPVTAVKPK